MPPSQCEAKSHVRAPRILGVRGSTLLAFCAGAIAAALPRGALPTEQPPLARSTSVVRAVRLVRGVAPEAAAAREAAPAVPLVARAEQGRARAEAPRVRPSDIAREALGYSAYVSGGGVYGAGVVLDDQGHVITCLHVVDGMKAISVAFADGSSTQAVVVERDPELDLALLKTETPAAHSTIPRVDSAARVEAGDDLYSMGAPRKMPFTLSRGMASFVGRSFSGVPYIQTDIALNGGSSGGAVINERGEVVGISAFVLKDSQGLAFALPIDYVYRRFGQALAAKPRGSVADADFDAWRRRASHSKVQLSTRAP